MKKGEIKLSYRNGQGKTVDAYIIGNFGIHYERWRVWRATHIQTGHALPRTFNTREQAEQFVKSITKNDSWNMKGAVLGDISKVVKQRMSRLKNIYLNEKQQL